MEISSGHPQLGDLLQNTKDSEGDTPYILAKL